VEVFLSVVASPLAKQLDKKPPGMLSAC